jgi:hypothetical protein
MPRFQFSLGPSGTVRESGAVTSDSFRDALEAIAEQSEASVGDTLEIGVPGFPPARFELVKTGRKSRGWKPTRDQLAPDMLAA